MGARVWIRARDEELLRNIKILQTMPLNIVCRNIPMESLFVENPEGGDSKIVPIFDNILEGRIENEGIIGGLKNHFVLAKRGVWVSQEGTQKSSFAMINNHQAYGEGILITPYDEIQARFHLKQETLSQVAGFHRVELQYGHDMPFVARTFATYYSSQAVVCKPKGTRTEHLLLYSSDRTESIKKARTK